MAGWKVKGFAQMKIPMVILIFVGVFIAMENPFAGLIWCIVLFELDGLREKVNGVSNK